VDGCLTFAPSFWGSGLSCTQVSQGEQSRSEGGNSAIAERVGSRKKKAPQAARIFHNFRKLDLGLDEAIYNILWLTLLLNSRV
jgi:ketopantoate reductase